MENKLELGKQIIDKVFNLPAPQFAMIGVEKTTNFINNVGKKLGIEKVSLDEPELYEALSEYLKTKRMANNQKNEGLDVDAILKESVGLELPVSKNILRYEEDDVVKTIKDIMSKEFKDIILERVVGDEGGVFYTSVLRMMLPSDVAKDLEAKRFYIAQTIAKFKSSYTTALSSILPVVNVSTGSYSFSKNSDELTFDVTVCLSHTNDREWVTGAYKGDTKKKLNKIAVRESKNGEDKNVIVETFTEKKHIVKPMTLQDAINAFNNQEINFKVLETAIKACGRSELELYVLKTVGIDIPDNKDKEDAKEEKPKEKEDFNEALGKLRTVEIKLDPLNKIDAIDVCDSLKRQGIKANARTMDRIVVRYPSLKFSDEQIEQMTGGTIINGE